MKRKRYSDEQIAFALRQAEGGTTVEEICRKLGVRADVLPVEEAVRRDGHGGDPQAEAARGGERQAEAACRRPEPGQDHAAGCFAKRMVRPGVRREVVGVLQGTYQVSERRAEEPKVSPLRSTGGMAPEGCSAMGFGRSSQRTRSRRDPQVALRMRLKDLAAVRVRYGTRRLHVLLRREGWVVNHKRIHRLYAEEGLSIRTKLPRRKRAWRTREGRLGAEAANEVWAELPKVPPAQPVEWQRRGWTSCRTSCSTAARSGS